MRIIDILGAEHRLIEQFLEALSRAVQKMERDERISTPFFSETLVFGRTFVDKFHHFKEEHLMFEQLAHKKNGDIDAHVVALRQQHDRGRSHLAEIQGSIDGYTQGQLMATTVILENLAAYISMLRYHIHREDTVFYPLALGSFSDEEQRALLEQFKEEDAKVGRTAFENSRIVVARLNSLLGYS